VTVLTSAPISGLGARTYAGAVSDDAGELDALFTELGVRSEDVEVAKESGTLLALPAEHFLLPGDRRYDLADLAAACGSETESLSKLWLALGFPHQPGARLYTQGDVDVMRTFLRNGEATITDYTVHEARVISASLAHVAEVFVDELWDQHFAAGQSETEALTEIAPSADLERVESLLLHLLRRHLVASIYRRQALHDQASRHGAAHLAVGFADLAEYSTLSRDMTDTELTQLVVEFEKVAYDVATSSGGRVIKTLGDGVMFVAEDVACAAEIALTLASSSNPHLPPVRVGLGWGPVLVREGDCFGPTVNLVSRIVAAAEPGTIVVDAPTATELRARGSIAVTPIGARSVKSFGEILLFGVQRQ
jgi:adenylate cyclase